MERTLHAETMLLVGAEPLLWYDIKTLPASNHGSILNSFQRAFILVPPGVNITPFII